MFYDVILVKFGQKMFKFQKATSIKPQDWETFHYLRNFTNVKFLGFTVFVIRFALSQVNLK